MKTVIFKTLIAVTCSVVLFTSCKDEMEGQRSDSSIQSDTTNTGPRSMNTPSDTTIDRETHKTSDSLK